MIELILDYPNLTLSDWKVFAAIARLGSDSYRDDVAKVAGVSIRQVSRSAAQLEAVGLLVNRRYYDHAAGKTRCDRIVTLLVDNLVQVNRVEADTPGQSDGLVPLVGGQSDEIVPLVGGQSDTAVPSPPEVNAVIEPYGAMGQECPTMTCMHDDDKEEIRSLLSFLDVGGLEKLLELDHLTVELAEAWAQHKAWRDLNDGWGGIKNPAGYIYKQIKKGVWPTYQQELPEAALDLTDQMADHPLAQTGARFVNGVWK